MKSHQEDQLQAARISYEAAIHAAQTGVTASYTAHHFVAIGKLRRGLAKQEPYIPFGQFTLIHHPLIRSRPGKNLIC